MDAPRASPIASVSLGAPRRFGFRLHTDHAKAHELTLGHGSMLIMENVCHFLYQHALLPETHPPSTSHSTSHSTSYSTSDTRVNLTFRSKRPVVPQAVVPQAVVPPASSEATQLHPAPCTLHPASEATQLHPPPPLPARTASPPSLPPPPPPPLLTIQPPAVRVPLFVGLTANVDHTIDGFKQRLLHPFESPFITDSPDVAAARYTTWLKAQPVSKSVSQ